MTAREDPAGRHTVEHTVEHTDEPTDEHAGPGIGRSVSQTVGEAESWTVGSMKMATIEDQRVAVVRTASGFHAVDNACPHQGYGLVTGSLDGELLTCQWHNWKFDVRTGRCLKGEEDVARHRVEVLDGEVLVTVNRPTTEERRAKLWPSLRRGIQADYSGQIARDSLRLLETGTTPGEIMAAGLEETAAKTDYGLGHELAMATDCLALAEIRHGTDRALPLVQGLVGLAETTRDRPRRATPPPDPTISVPEAIEAEDAESAMAGVLGLIEAGADPSTLRHQLIAAASAHHLGYGHGMIYTQKTFEMLDRIGWDNAHGLLPHLAARLVWSTREDTLPYMRKAMKSLAQVDLDALATAERADGWQPELVVDRLLRASEAPIEEAVGAATAGAGVEGLLDAVSIGASKRLLDHDLRVELDSTDPFGWLDITHALTTAQAARWAWRIDPGPHTARAALFVVWLLFDSGRSERRRSEPLETPFDPARIEQPAIDDLAEALRFGDAASAVALAAVGDPTDVGNTLAEASLGDRAGSFIVAAHLVKTTEAARRETTETGSRLPLAAAARFLASPRVERFVAANVAESIGFVTTGRPPGR